MLFCTQFLIGYDSERMKRGRFNMKRAITFGEIMLRLSPPGFQRFGQAKSFDVVYGGAESNASVSLANYGVDSAFVTLVPDNPIGQSAVNELRQFGVDTQYMVRKGSRLGIYFYEKGVSMRPSKVIYDRKDSSIAQIAAGDINWDEVFEGADWFHFTGITPALSASAAEETLAAVKAAKAHGVTVSCDLNYRKNLWSREEAGRVMGQIVPMVDVLIANEEDAADVFGIHASGTDIYAGKLDVEGYRSVASQLVERFGCSKIAITLRESISASDNNWSGMLYDGKTGEMYVSKKYSIRLVDRLGGGDSFGSGLIYALLSDYSLQDAVEYAAAASALKQTIEGDVNRVTVPEVKNLMGGNASGRVQR